MRHMRLVAALGLTLSLLASGCAQNRMVPNKVTVVAMPEIAADPKPTPEPTLLENYQECVKGLDAQRTRCATLENNLATERSERQAAQDECADLRATVDELGEQNAELTDLKEKYEEIQQTALGLETEVRALRDELLQARLAGTRSEQALLAVKIEQAMERRRRVLQSSQEGAELNAPETELDHAKNSVIP